MSGGDRVAPLPSLQRMAVHFFNLIAGENPNPRIKAIIPCKGSCRRSVHQP